MKNLILIISLFLGELSLAGEEVRIPVKGMVCAFCAQGIEKQFKKYKEVEEVEVSLKNKYVKLKFVDGKRLTNSKIAEILKDAGYDADFESTKAEK